MRRSVPRTWAKWPPGRSRQVHRAHVLTGHCAGSRGAGALGTHGASRLERPKRVSRRGRERPWERRFHRGPTCRAAPAADAGPPGDVGTPGTLGAAAAWTPRGALHLGARRGDILVSLSWHSSPTTITRLGASLSVSRADGGAVCTRREQGRPVNGSGGRGARRARDDFITPLPAPDATAGLSRYPSWQLALQTTRCLHILRRPWTPRASPGPPGSGRNAGPRLCSVVFSGQKGATSQGVARPPALGGCEPVTHSSTGQVTRRRRSLE